MRRVYVTEYVGLSTRLETLALAFLISDYYGHEVCIDWHELDALRVVGARVRGRRLAGRIGALKLYESSIAEDLYRAAEHRHVNLRTHHGPRHLLERYYLPTARRVKLRPDLIASIRATFAPYSERPLVGVHLRRGDFGIADPESFDPNARAWPGVPDWWFEHVMADLQRAVPDVVFFVSCTGSLADYPWLKRFEVFDLAAESPYDYRHHRSAGHHSQRHPAADLFALGCCSLMVGSSCSTFTHYAANMLGEPTTILLPPSHKIFADRPEYGCVRLHGRGASDWYAACRTGAGFVPLADAAGLAVPRGANVDWM